MHDIHEPRGLSGVRERCHTKKAVHFRTHRPEAHVSGSNGIENRPRRSAINEHFPERSIDLYAVVTSALTCDSMRQLSTIRSESIVPKAGRVSTCRHIPSAPACQLRLISVQACITYACIFLCSYEAINACSGHSNSLLPILTAIRYCCTASRNL